MFQRTVFPQNFKECYEKQKSCGHVSLGYYGLSKGKCTFTFHEFSDSLLCLCTHRDYKWEIEFVAFVRFIESFLKHLSGLGSNRRYLGKQA